MSTQIKYAYKRHNTWVYRRTYPHHLQPLLGSSLKQSLKTADAKTAKARVAELNQTFTNIVKEAEQHVSANTGKDPAIHIHEGGIPTNQAKDLAAQAQSFRNQAHYWAWLRVYVERKRLG